MEKKNPRVFIFLTQICFVVGRQPFLNLFLMWDYAQLRTLASDTFSSFIFPILTIKAR